MKKFQWNINLIYDYEYKLQPLANTVTVPNYEYHFNKVEEQLAEMTRFDLASEVLNKISKKP